MIAWIGSFTRESRRILGTSDLAGLKAGSADVHLATVTVDNDIDALDVGAELTDRDAVRVADGATSNGVLTADFANFGHVYTLLGRLKTSMPREQTAMNYTTGVASSLDLHNELGKQYKGAGRIQVKMQKE